MKISPLVGLGPEVFERILTHVAGAGERIDCRLSTDGFRRVLPLAVCCRAHWELLRKAVRGIDMLPLGFATRRACKEGHTLPPLPPFPFPEPADSTQGNAVEKKKRTILDSELLAALKALPGVRNIKLALPVAITDVGLRDLANVVVGLRELKISGNHSVTSAGIEALVACTQLEVLDLSYCAGPNDSAGAYIGKMPALRELNVSCWRITDEFCRLVAEAPSLESLSLASCVDITDVGCVALGRARSLRRLKLRGCTRITDDGVHALSVCLELRSIDLSLIKNLTDNSSSVLGRMSGLETVILEQCSDLSDATTTFLSEIRTLKHINLSHISHITDLSADALVVRETLETINLSCCAQISDRTVQAIATLPNLRVLHVSRCTRLTDISMRSLEDAANAPLDLVDVRRCTNISDAACDSLAKHCTRVLNAVSPDVYQPLPYPTVPPAQAAV